jgi:hypothetical protein
MRSSQYGPFMVDAFMAEQGAFSEIANQYQDH